MSMMCDTMGKEKKNGIGRLGDEPSKCSLLLTAILGRSFFSVIPIGFAFHFSIYLP